MQASHQASMPTTMLETERMLEEIDTADLQH